MTHRLACEMADVFAAAGVVAGPILSSPGGCQPARPVPIVGFYGTEDPIVAYEGGVISEAAARRMYRLDGGLARLLSAQAWAGDWAERNECQVHGDVLGPGPDVSVVLYSECREGWDVVLYTIEGGGHTWPGGPDFPLIGRTTQNQCQRVMSSSSWSIRFAERGPARGGVWQDHPPAFPLFFFALHIDRDSKAAVRAAGSGGC
jgi:polyhydroxybutyrate depolymerase